MSDIFISYAAEDQPRIQRLVKAFEQEGFSVWWDKKIPPGKTWDQVIGKALEDAKCIVVIWSRLSIESNWVKEEADIGVKRGILVPVVVDNIQIPIGFRRIEAANLIEWKGESSNPEFLELMDSISALINPNNVQQKDKTIKIDDLTPSRLTLLLQKIKNHKRIIGFSTAVILVVAALLIFLPSEKSIRVWKVGSPHKGDTPDITAPLILQQESERMGYELHVEGFPAKGFAAKFFEAFKKNEEPDILIIDNYGIINGITTDLGNITGIGSSDTVRNSLILVTGSLDEFKGAQGGWAFLIKGSENNIAARNLSLRPPACNELWASSLTPLQGELNQILIPIARAYIEGAMFTLQHYADIAYLRLEAPVQQNIRIGFLKVCGYWGNNNLAFVPVIGTTESEHSIGQTTLLLILRKQRDKWQLITAANDPVTTGEFVGRLPLIVELLNKNHNDEFEPIPAKLLTPKDGQYPIASPGQRFGDFIWQPSPSPNVVAEIAEFAYKNDARLFIRFRSEQDLKKDRISSGNLWTTESIWKWRIWSISNAGIVSFSEVRSFHN
jgi:hypothetical protein